MSLRSTCLLGRPGQAHSDRGGCPPAGVCWVCVGQGTWELQAYPTHHRSPKARGLYFHQISLTLVLASGPRMWLSLVPAQAWQRRPWFLLPVGPEERARPWGETGEGPTKGAVLFMQLKVEAWVPGMFARPSLLQGRQAGVLIRTTEVSICSLIPLPGTFSPAPLYCSLLLIIQHQLKWPLPREPPFWLDSMLSPHGSRPET